MAFSPLLTGPRMAVWGYFPFDERVLDTSGKKADWAWAMSQWDRVIGAGAVVRLVVADQPYSRLDPGAPGEAQRSDVRAKFAGCRAAGQLVFGRVRAAGGKLPLGQVGQTFDDPLNPGHQVPGVADQIDAWRRLYGDQIDGIYIDSGPTDCTDPSLPGSVRGIPSNYRDYVGTINRLGYKVYLQAAQYPDNQPPGTRWLRDLEADFLELWEAGVLPYRSKYQAKDACRPDQNLEPADWWDPGPELRWSRVHVITDCRDEVVMESVARLAVEKRGAWTVWITRSRQDPSLESFFDTLPPYWDQEVAFFRPFLEADERARKEATDTKDSKDATDTKEQKESKDATDTKNTTDTKNDTDAKNESDAAAAKVEKEAKEEKDAADVVPTKDDPKDDDTPKQEKDLKDFKDDPDDKNIHGEVFLKDSEQGVKTLEAAAPPSAAGLPEDFLGEDDDDEEVPTGRTYIKPDERPSVGERVVADPPEDDE